MSRTDRWTVTLATLLLASPLPATVPALAQTAPPVPSEPGATSASYGDWVVRCQRGVGDKPVRICEAAQTMQVQGQNQPVAQIAIGRTGAGQPSQVTLLLPASVSFPSSVHILADDKDTPGFELLWSRCVPGACVAEAAARDDVLKRWRGPSPAGRITFKNAAGQEVAVRLSFRGLAQALDALTKEPS